MSPILKVKYWLKYSMISSILHIISAEHSEVVSPPSTPIIPVMLLMSGISSIGIKSPIMAAPSKAFAMALSGIGEASTEAPIVTASMYR